MSAITNATLDEVENQFLEVLVDKFELCREGQGIRLRVQFNGSNKAVWNHAGIDRVRESISSFCERSVLLQGKLDDFLVHARGQSLSVSEPGFPFRFASGGVLPVVRMGDRDYFCLFYRDIRPIGWNIANGGCLTRAELCSPFRACERELAEELIVLDHDKRTRFVFRAEAEKSPDWLAASDAAAIWKSCLGIEVGAYAEHLAPVKWLDGHDRVDIESERGAISRIERCILNINAIDFGIEVDRIAKLNIDEQCTILDGEIGHGVPVNQIVGLFEVSRVSGMMATGQDSFVPDIMFWSGQRVDIGTSFQEVLQDQYFKQARFESERGKTTIRQHRDSPKTMDLCPVTRRVIARFISSDTGAADDLSTDVFISYPSEDEIFANVVFEECVRGGKLPFLSSKSIRESNFGAAIDDALDRASHMVVVVSDHQRALKDYVAYEWRSFHHDMLSHRKPGAKLIPFVTGFKLGQLPRRLREQNSVVFEPARIEASCRQLLAMLT